MFVTELSYNHYQSWNQLTFAVQFLSAKFQEWILCLVNISVFCIPDAGTVFFLQYLYNVSMLRVAVSINGVDGKKVKK